MTANKTFIVNDLPISKEHRDFADTDALDFTPRVAVETPADIAATANTPLFIPCAIFHFFGLLSHYSACYNLI
jgi:hypothetical protein